MLQGLRHLGVSVGGIGSGSADCGTVFLVLLFSAFAAAAPDTGFAHNAELPRTYNGGGTDPDSSWGEPWEEPSWPEVGPPPQDLADDVLPEVSRRSPAPGPGPGPFAINRWPILHPARGLLVGLGTRKRHPPYHPVPRFRGATDLSDLNWDFPDGPRLSGATERSRNSKARTYSAGELLNLLVAGRKTKEENPTGSGISLRYGMSR